MRLIFILLTISVLCLGCPRGVNAQTCCSGGVPLSGNVGFPSGDKGLFQVQLDYDDNVLKTLKSGNDHLDDDARTRHTRSILFQTGYTFANKLSLDVLASYVWQERKIVQGTTRDVTRTAGLGDLTVLLKYKWLSLGQPEHTSITSAVGVKMPTGSSDLIRSNGLSVNADLQPGSGAWDGVFWTRIVHGLAKRPSMNMSSTMIFVLKGKNKDYLDVFTYRFGNEIQWHIGIADRLFLGKMIFDPSIQLRYRRAFRDRQDGFEIESTGGDWIMLNWDNRFWINNQLALHGGIEFPIYGRVNGTQLSPTYRLNFGIYLQLNVLKNKNQGIEF